MKKYPIEYLPLLGIFILLLGFKEYRALVSFESHIEQSLYINPNDPIDIGLHTFIGYGPLFIAKNKGFYDSVKLNVNLHKIEGDAERRAALISGQIDIATHTLDVLISLRANGLDVKAFLVIDTSVGADGIIANQSVEKITDLKGKTVAYATGTPSHFFLHQILSGAGLSINDIKSVITDTPDKAAQSFISGKVDAAVSWEPWLTNASQSDGDILIDSESRPSLIKDVMYAESSTLSTKEKELNALVKAWFLTLEWMSQNPQESKKIIAEEFGISEKEMSMVFPKVQFPDKEENQLFFTDNANNQSLYRLYDKISEVSEVWISEKIISQSDTPDQGLFPYFFK